MHVAPVASIFHSVATHLMQGCSLWRVPTTLVSVSLGRLRGAVRLYGPSGFFAPEPSRTCFWMALFVLRARRRPRHKSSWCTAAPAWRRQNFQGEVSPAHALKESSRTSRSAAWA